MVVFVIDLAKCRVEIVGIGSALKSAWVMQCGRPLIDAGDAYLVERSLLHDLDPMCTETLSETLPTGVPTVRAPPLADVNARSGLFRPIQESCLKRMIVFGERPVAERFASSSSATITLAITIHRDDQPLIIGDAPRRREGPIASPETSRYYTDSRT